MPVLSLPVALISDLFPRTFFLPPIRIPFPVLRIGSILPCSLNGPLKDSLLALFRLAWSNKIQLPVLITVCFLALDVRLQLEINIFWEPPRNGNRQRGGNRIVNGPGPRNNVDGGHAAAVHGAALVAATIVHRERERLRLNDERDRQLGLRRHAEDRLASIDHHDEVDEENNYTDTDSNTLEWFESPEAAAAALFRRKRLRKKQSSKKIKSAKNSLKKLQSVTAGNTTLAPTLNNENETEDAIVDSDDTDDDEDEDDSDSTDDLSSDDDSDSDFDDDDPHRGVGGGHGEASHGYDNDHEDFFDHNRGSGGDSDSDDSSGGSPLVVELEIRQRTQAAAVFNLIQNNFCPPSVLKTGICGSHLFKYQFLPATHSQN